MIRPTQADIGRRVVYRDWSGRPEEGVITSIPLTHDPPAVFVRYGSDQHSKLTYSRHLEWTSASLGTS